MYKSTYKTISYTALFSALMMINIKSSNDLAFNNNQSSSTWTITFNQATAHDRYTVYGVPVEYYDPMAWSREQAMLQAAGVSSWAEYHASSAAQIEADMVQTEKKKIAECKESLLENKASEYKAISATEKFTIFLCIGLKNKYAIAGCQGLALLAAEDAKLDADIKYRKLLGSCK